MTNDQQRASWGGVRALSSLARRRLTFGLFGVAVLAMGLLLWARLVLVTGHPRMALAEPKGQAGAGSQLGPSQARPDAAGSKSTPTPMGSAGATSSVGQTPER